LLLALCTAVLATPLPFPKPPGKADLKALQGEWEVVAQRFGKIDRPGESLTLSVKDDRLTFLVGGEMRTSWVFTLDPKKAPRTIDLHRVGARWGGGAEKLLAVYHLDRDSFTFAYGKERRPTDLEGKKPGDWVYICKGRK